MWTSGGRFCEVRQGWWRAGCMCDLLPASISCHLLPCVASLAVALAWLTESANRCACWSAMCEVRGAKVTT